MKKSILGNLKRNNSNNCPKKHLELSFDGTIALGAATQLSTKNFTKALTGVTESGYTFPDDLDPIFAKNAGETVEIYAQMLTDTATDAANYNTINDITIQDVTLTGTNKTKELYLITKSRGTAVGTEDKPQCMLMILRNATGTQIPEEIEPLHFVYYTKLPSNLATILEYPTANTTFHAEFDIKTGNYDGEPGVGDYRATLTVSEDATGLRWRLQGDNNANGKDIVPGLTAYNNGAGGYWQEFSGYGEVVLGETLRIDFYIKPPASNVDVTTGETTVRITKVSDGSYVLLSKVGGVQKGIANLPLSRFMFILYNLGTPPGSAPYLDKPLTGIEIWDKRPYFLGWEDPVAVDTSLAGGATQPREGTDTLSIDFTSGTPSQITIARNDNPSFAVWPDGAMSESFTEVTGGLEFDLSLAHMNLGVNTVGVKASYADYRKSNDSLSVTIEAVTPEPVTKTITVSMLGGLNQTREGRDVFQIAFTSGTPTSLVFARNDNATFAQWPTGNLQAYFTEVTGGLEFDLELTALNLGANTLAVTATYSDASTATDSLSLVLTEIDAGAVTLGPLPWVATPLASATMFASPTGNDANPGTLASPKTFQGAITAATAGSVVFLRGGTYTVTDAAHIQAWAVGTAGAPIIFESYPGELAIIDGSGMTPWVGNKRINVSGQYQKFRGLRVTGFPENGFLVGTGSHHTTIDGCEIDNCHLSGIMNFNSSDNRYINLHIHDCSDVGGAANGGNADGITVASGSRNYVGNCLVERCSDDGIDAWQSQDSVFEFNIVTGCGLGDGNGNGFKCGGADIGANAMVNNNLAYNNRALGFDVNTGINVTFKNNTSYDNDAQGYGLEPDTICINNVSSGDGSIKYGTGIPTNNSWNITGTLTFISTTEGNANFLKVTQDGIFDGIGWNYL